MPKIAVLSDIHGNLPALERVVADLKARQVDAVVNLGDHASGPLWPKETLQFLTAQDWIQISGNHDWDLAHLKPPFEGPSNQYAYDHLDQAQLEWLGSLPASVEYRGMLLVHGAPSSQSAYLLETVEHGRTRLSTPQEIEARLGQPSMPVILCGHSHLPRVIELPNDVLIVNPGSVGLQAYLDDATPHVVENGSPHARYAIMSQSEGGWQVELIALPYDHRKAAAQARKNNREDWEVGLLTGTMQGMQVT